MNYSRITLLGNSTTAALLTSCSGSSGKPGGKNWTRRAYDSKVVIEWHYVGGSKNIVDLHLKGEDDTVHHLEQEPVTVDAFYSSGRPGFYLENDEGLVYWIETGNFIGHGCKAR